MYQASIFNNGIETIVHFPSSNQDDPHVSEIPLKEELSVVDSISFKLYPNNDGYNKVSELSTKVKVIDLRDNTVRFTGRILDINERMDNDSKIYKTVVCEGCLSYLNDTKLRGDTYTADSVSNFLSQILQIHNSKVEVDKQIQLGIVNLIISENIIHSCSFKTVLAELLLVRDKIGGEIRVREVNNVRYLDWLGDISTNTLSVSLGINMKDMIKNKDVTSLGTRIIPLGANNLTIESVNDGIDYLEDSTARNLYGVIEKTIEYKDVTDPTILKNLCTSDLPNYIQPSYLLESNALDLSYISGNKPEQFTLGTKLHMTNEFMNVDDLYTIVKLDLDLLAPYDPKLTMSNKQIILSTTINDLRNTTIQNDGVYNNVQIGRSYGIRATKSDGKAVTTINATDGIKIQTDRGHGLVNSFYIDIDGNLKINTYDEITGEITSGLNLANTKISAVVQTSDGGASWELNKDAFIIAFNKAGSGYTEINENGIIIYDGRFKIKKGSDTVFYVNTNGRCTADGGFVVDDGSSSTKISSAGINITNNEGYTGLLTVSTTYDRLEVPGSLYVSEFLALNSNIKSDLQVEGILDVDGESGFYANAYFDDDVDIGDDLNVSDNITSGGTIYCGDLDVNGSKNCLQSTLNYGERRINALETCEYYFGDKGFGIAREDTVVIMFDDIFLECVNTNIDYFVSIQVYNNKKPITNIERFSTYCIIHCEIGTEFSWSIEAKRIDYENIRLQQKMFDTDFKIDNINFNSDFRIETGIENYYSQIQTIDNTGMENYLLETDTETEKYLMEVI